VRRRRLPFAILAAAIGLTGLVVVGAFLYDPESQFFDVQFRNDTNDVVLLSLCADESCRHTHWTDTLAAGRSKTEQVSDRSIETRWIARSPSHRILGCITRSYDHKVSNLRISISAATPCRGGSADSKPSGGDAGVPT
jgi:hypothetical protein